MKNTMCPLARNAALALLALTTLSACDTVRDLAGLDRTGPDEYAVSPTDPLVIPPDFTLRPPQPGAPRPQEVRAEDKAKQALLGVPAGMAVETSSTAPAGAEAAILANTKNYASRVPNEAIKQGAIPQPEVMRILGGGNAPTPTAETVDVPAATDRAIDPEAEKLGKIINAPTTDGTAIKLEETSKPFWDSWF